MNTSPGTTNYNNNTPDTYANPTISPTVDLTITDSDPHTPTDLSAAPSTPNAEVPSPDALDQYMQNLQQLPALIQSLSQQSTTDQHTTTPED